MTGLKNSRAAWLAWRGHYEGESFLNIQKEDTYKAIESVHYKGERSTFTFEHFAGILTKGYNDLQHGQPILEAKKVRDLLNKITDLKLGSAKQAIRINPQYKNSFDLAINFLVESVETLDKGKPTMISELQQNQNAGKGEEDAKVTIQDAPTIEGDMAAEGTGVEAEIMADMGEAAVEVVAEVKLMTQRSLTYLLLNGTQWPPQQH